MTETVETILGKTLDARYTLLDKLGAGGQAEVWRAHDAKRGVDVALKVLTPKTRENEAWSALEHEYSIASLLDHPSILKVYPPERSGEAMILPMELAPGGDLRRLRGAGFLEIIPVLLEISQALEHAHERGVVHRDLKPGNILFDARGRAKLADFGVAETATTDEGTPSTASSAVPTRDTNKHGYSPFTASPAQLRGEPPTPSDDVYGLGALAYELLSGYPPYYPHFDKKRAMEERVPTLAPTRQIPPLLGTLVMHMLAKDPKRRPRTMRAVIDELDASLNDTLTYDFENVSPATPTGSAAVVAAAEAAAAKSAAARARDTSSSDAPSKPYVWTPGSGDRRSRADRRGRRKEDFAPSSDSDSGGRRSSDNSADDGSRSSRRPGADALARIDAALERSANSTSDTGSHRKPSQDAARPWESTSSTGTHRTVDTGSHRVPPGASGSAADTGSHRTPSGASASAGDTGSHRVPTGKSSSAADTGSHRAAAAGAANSTADTGSHRVPTGKSNSAADTGSHRAAAAGAANSTADTGSHRTTDTGSHLKPTANGALSTSDTGSRPRPSVGVPTYEPTVKIRSPFLQPNDGSRSRSSHFMSETSGSLGRPKSGPPPSPTPPPSDVFRSKGQSSPMTPAEAAAIVAAARAAAKAEAAKSEGAGGKADRDRTAILDGGVKADTDTSQTVALPPLTWDTSKTVALPPLSPDYVPPEFREAHPERQQPERQQPERHQRERQQTERQQPGRAAQTAARSASPASKSEPPALPTPANTGDLSKTMALPPLSPDYVPPEFREEQQQRPSLTAARAALWDRRPESGNAPNAPARAADTSKGATDTSKTVALPPLPANYVPTEFRNDPDATAVQDFTAARSTTTRELTPPPLAPTSPMWPIEGKAAAVQTPEPAAAKQQPAKQQPAKQQPRKTEPVIHGPQPTFKHDNVTVGTYPDPTSILTRDTVVQSAPMPVNWGDVRLDELPKVTRLRPIQPRRWPWVVLGLAAGAAAAVYFWLPRFDTQDLPPEVAAVVEPLKTAIAANSPGAASQAPASPTAGTPTAASQEDGAQGAGQVDASTPVAGASAPGAPTGGVRARNPGASDGIESGNAGSPVAASGARNAGAAGGVGAAAAATTSAANAPAPRVFTPAEEQRLREMRKLFDDRLASLEARGAGVWGGREFAMAKTRAAESVGAHDAGNPRLSQERLATASKLLDTVESKAPQALTTQVDAGEQALKAGQQEVAGQAFDLARRINPNDRRAVDGQHRTENLPAVLPLLADAQNAEADHNYARAAQDYSQALSLDPTNATAKAGQARANAAFGDDNYAKAVGAGFAALGAGRLDEAHEEFVRARALNPRGAEAFEGLKRVGAALTARGFASMRQRAAALENQERWEEAERTYEDVLSADSSLAFAQEGKARTTSRADLHLRLQQFIDRPDRLSSVGVREDARALLETARAQSPQGPVIRSQIARLESLLPGYDRPVRLSLVSDNSTHVVISSVGAFGTFSRRDIELRPGKYTLIGTRNGFRDVRREITVAPGQDSQTIRVSCSEPI